ncbi:hypothetical protein Fmac_032551 [Flemingia macrophylla]|uniref:Calcium uniporter protein C-terminal domain-containing protein n=1 Tax=Flemingia macrophylla TaxID=520843 RepID=A0ABD1L582_9FABA
MALRKLLSKRFFDSTKTTVPSKHTVVVSSPSLQQAMISPQDTTQPRSAAAGGFPRRRAVYHSVPARLPEFLSLPVGERLREKLKGIDNAAAAAAGGRLRIGDVVPPPGASGMSASDARKILRAVQMEKVKARLRNVSESSIPVSEYLRICVEACQNPDQGAQYAKILDDSGNVIVFGDTVFLRPEQVAKSIENLIHQSIANPNDPRRKELEQMEKQKGVINDKARARVRSELYFGLGFLTIQTLGFMRLTFWELSWDVMEPICFFTTSMGFAFAYLFFLRTSSEPSFQGFFYHRLKIKQKRLMKIYNFDMHRYSELRKACCPSYDHDGANSEPSPPFHHHSGETNMRTLRR